jgi:hypothetical protein
MRLFALALATAMTIAAVPAGAGSTAAEPSMQLAQVDVRIHGDRDRYHRDWRHDRDRYRYRRYGHHGCRTVVIREHRHGTTIVRRIKRCD